jgi:hypothetical protein
MTNACKPMVRTKFETTIHHVVWTSKLKAAGAENISLHCSFSRRSAHTSQPLLGSARESDEVRKNIARASLEGFHNATSRQPSNLKMIFRKRSESSSSHQSLSFGLRLRYTDDTQIVLS